MSTTTEDQQTTSRYAQGRLAFRHWRWQRPFWAGLFTLLAGLPIAYFPYANVTLGQLTIRMATTAGAGSLVIGVLLVTLGLTMWFQPHSRIFAGVAAIMLSLVSLVVSNFGGFLAGFLLGLLGGGMSLAWAPGETGGEESGEAQEGDTAGSPRGARLSSGRPAASAMSDMSAASGADGAPREPGTGSALAGFHEGGPRRQETALDKGEHRAE